MRKYAAALAVVLLMAAAFFLPEWLSALNDRQLLDNPVIQAENEEREGFAESMQLSVAEKVLLLRGGGFTAMELSREKVESVTVLVSGDSQDQQVLTYVNGENLADLKADEESVAYGEEVSRLWDARMTAARREVRNLQSLGGLPQLWDSGSDLECSGSGEWLYMDPDTRMSFQVYQLTLRGGNYALDLIVDMQSERILSFSLQWGWEDALDWGMRGAANFGGVWRNYWELDTVNSGWYDSYTRGILEQLEVPPSGDYGARSQVSFTYDGQAFAVPLESMGFGGRTAMLTWNR